jgi:hypothetical protein
LREPSDPDEVGEVDDSSEIDSFLDCCSFLVSCCFDDNNVAKELRQKSQYRYHGSAEISVLIEVCSRLDVAFGKYLLL